MTFFFQGIDLYIISVQDTEGIGMDQLVCYLNNAEPGRFVIGAEDCNLLILGDGGRRPTGISGLLLVVGCAGPIVPETLCALRDKYKRDPFFSSLFVCGEKLAHLAGIPFIMAGYEKCDPTKIDAAFIDAMRFLVVDISSKKKENRRPVILESDAFAAYLHALLGIRAVDAGTHKQKNKWVADAFHVWSRCKLSSRLVKQDFDAIYQLGDRFAMIEVKRSSAKSLQDWTPYKDDMRNYDIQNQFAKIIEAPFFTFHHADAACDDATGVGCYQVLDVNPVDGSEWIDYKKTIVKAQEIPGILKRQLESAEGA